MNLTEQVIEMFQKKAAAESGREAVEGYNYKVEDLSKLKEVLELTIGGLEKLHKAYSIFAPISSPAISPDGKLGGAGYIQRISDIKATYIECINKLSDISDTLADELNNPLWTHLLSTSDQEDIEEVLEEKERMESKVDHDDILIETEIEEVEEKKEDEELLEEAEEITFEIPQKRTKKASQDSILKKIQRIAMLKTGQLLDQKKSALVKQIYLKTASIENLGRSKTQEARKIEFNKLYKAIKQVLKLNN